MNPTNRFACPHCQAVFTTSFGVLGKCGSLLRDAHALSCPLNPTNLACQYCNAVFLNTQGLSKVFCRDVSCQRAKHQMVCAKNPNNNFSCDQCGLCFSTRHGWLRKVDGRVERDAHQEKCGTIPCQYELVNDKDFEGWVTLSPLELEGLASSCKLEEDVLCKPCDPFEHSEPVLLKESGESSKPCMTAPAECTAEQRVDLHSSTSTQSESFAREETESDFEDGGLSDLDSVEISGDGLIERDLFFDAESFEAEAEDATDPRRNRGARAMTPQAVCDEIETDTPFLLLDSDASDID
mmetsp:Transcript_64430/g.118682  ORF Transcript_64430/g.118682 Transcript_64430/m.118682 type:complete len:295 (+) Transcript_64430:2-886(+)